jgi:chemotaxis signal transduction protein
MTERDAARGARVENLRRAFDQSFADVPRAAAGSQVDLLAIRVGGDGYVLRLLEVGGLFVDRPVTPVPTPFPELLGVAGFRASLVPVYDLGVLLGYPGSEAPRWMVSTTGEPSVGLVFDQFERQIRASQGAFAPDESRAHAHVRELATTSDGVRPVIFLPSVLEAIEARVGRLALPKEP